MSTSLGAWRREGEPSHSQKIAQESARCPDSSSLFSLLSPRSRVTSNPSNPERRTFYSGSSRFRGLRIR